MYRKETTMKLKGTLENIYYKQKEAMEEHRNKKTWHINNKYQTSGLSSTLSVIKN